MKHAIIFIFVTCLSIKPSAQEYSSLQFSEGISREDGLGHNHVECIFQDSDGFIWFGTRYGLTRYDGFDFITYRATNDEMSISGNWILSINEDYEGSLWIGTFHNGVNRFNRQTGKFYHFPGNPELGSRINNISLLTDSSVWLCTNNGLAKYIRDSNDFMVLLPVQGDPQSLNSSQVFDLLETSGGKYYVSTMDPDIQEFYPETFRFKSISYERKPELSVDWNKRIVEDFKGNLWISAYQHGLCCYNPSSGESRLYTQKPGELSTNILNGKMLVDPNGDIWISTDGDGINIFHSDEGRFSYLKSTDDSQQSLPSKQVYAFLLDNQNHIWIGFYDRGALLYDPASSRFKRDLFEAGDLNILKEKSVLSVFEDSRKNVWIGTDGDGLYCLNNEKVIVTYRYNILDPSSLSSDVITSIEELPGGDILVGTYAAGLNRIDKLSGRNSRFKVKETDPVTMSSSSIWEMFKDSRGQIWMGLLGSGTILYDPANDSFYDYGPESANPNRVNHPNIMVIMEDSDGDVWFGTEGEGVRILDRETNRISELSLQKDNPSLQYSLVKSFMQDTKGRIWIGTEGDGIFIYNKRSGDLQQLTVKEGLPDLIIQGMIEDERGNVWITTGNGLSLYNPGTFRIVNFYRSDGLAANEFNGDAVIRMQDGRILIGSTNGVDVFDPSSIFLNQNLPKVAITGLEILNKAIFAGDTVNGRVLLEKNITYMDEISIIHKDKLFTILFTALNYKQPEKCRFQYMLEGFDNDWVETSSNRRIATYSNLKSGTYTFKVRASNNDGKWGNNIRELKINVSPPYWATFWFGGLVGLFLIAAVLFIYRTRMDFYKNKFLQKETLQQKRIIELEMENLESELSKLTFFRMNRNRTLLDLKMRLQGLSVKAGDSVKGGLDKIIEEIDLEINSDKDWKHIEPQIDRTYNNFITNLKEKHSDLTLSELKIAAYVRMNLSTKEMAEFMHKTIRAIENDRYRLRKKLCMDSNDSLKDYLTKI